MISKQYVKSLAKRNPERARKLAARMMDGFCRASYADTTPGKRGKAEREISGWYETYRAI